MTTRLAPIEPRANPDLLGQDRAIVALRDAWRSGRAPHAWLLSGPRGVGKATLAFRFARALLAGEDAIDESLAMSPEHPVFRQVASGAHPDLRVLEPPREARANRQRSEIAVEVVRSASAAMHSTAAMGGHRVVIVDGAEFLNRNAANALLKPLEEPPPATTLILVSHHLTRVMPTLRSRCAKLRLGRLPDATVETILAHQADALDATERGMLARLARGSPGFALELAASEAGTLYRRLADGLGAEPVDRLELHGLAADLARHAEAEGLPAVMALLQELLGRAVAVGLEQPQPALYEDEREALARLVAARPLDRWARLWEKIGRLAAEADSVNLDRSQVLWLILDLLGPTSGQGDERLPDRAPLGGHHVLG
jgi:DNA polymerase III subunit delta'